jgi:nicotinamidase-related amidase
MLKETAPLNPADTALLVIDLQAKLVPACVEPKRLIERTRLLLHLRNELDLPLIVTTQYAKGLGPIVPEVLELMGDTPVHDKTSFGCFGDETIARELNELGRKTLLVAGIETHICVMQTVLGALDQKLGVHLLTDACSARKTADAEVGLNRMQRAGAILSSTEMAIYELLGASDSKAFKAMLPHLRD